MMFKENDQLDQGILLNPSSQQVFNVEIFLYELQRVSLCVQRGSDLSDPLLLFMVFAKAVRLDIQSVEIGVRPVPQKRNVFCPCVLFQMHLETIENKLDSTYLFDSECK